MLNTLFLLFATSPAASQAELQVHVGGKAYSLPAVGEAADAKDLPPPLQPETLATLSVWRSFAWDADKKKYSYRFAGTGETSAAIVLTADSSASGLSIQLDQAAKMVAVLVGPENLRKDSVAILCGTAKEFERVVDFVADLALTKTEDPIVKAYLDGDWRAGAKKGPTFYEAVTGTVGCVEGNSEKWAPDHELVRGYAQVALQQQAPYLINLLPIVAGLSWDVELHVCGDILSVPNVDDFQFDIGRGAWSASKIAAILKKVEKEVRKEQQRELELGDLPYLGTNRAESMNEAGIGWAVARHLARHHPAELPALLAAFSQEVVNLNTVKQADGSSVFNLPPGYRLSWQQAGVVISAQVPDFDFDALMDCVTRSCSTCAVAAPN
jgi:hypothetical protein